MTRHIDVTRRCPGQSYPSGLRLDPTCLSRSPNPMTSSLSSALCWEDVWFQCWTHDWLRDRLFLTAAPCFPSRGARHDAALSSVDFCSMPEVLPKLQAHVVVLLPCYWTGVSPVRTRP